MGGAVDGHLHAQFVNRKFLEVHSLCRRILLGSPLDSLEKDVGAHIHVLIRMVNIAITLINPACNTGD